MQFRFVVCFHISPSMLNTSTFILIHEFDESLSFDSMIENKCNKFVLNFLWIQKFELLSDV